MSGTTSQNKKIFEYMKTHGSITPMDALRVAGCMRLSARIAELKKQGIPIITAIDSTGEKRFARYYLAKDRDGKCAQVTEDS